MSQRSPTLSTRCVSNMVRAKPTSPILASDRSRLSRMFLALRSQCTTCGMHSVGEMLACGSCASYTSRLV